MDAGLDMVRGVAMVLELFNYLQERYGSTLLQMKATDFLVFMQLTNSNVTIA